MRFFPNTYLHVHLLSIDVIFHFLPIQYLESKRSASNGQVVQTCDETMWLEEDREKEDIFGSLHRRPKSPPDFDLKSGSVAYTLTKTFAFGDRQDVVPQSVARDPGKVVGRLLP